MALGKHVMSTVIEDLPTATTSAWKLTMSPTEIGCLEDEGIHRHRDHASESGGIAGRRWR